MARIIFLLVFFLLNTQAQDLKKVSIQFQWKHQYQYAGFYAAIEKGFYKDIGVEVSLKEWNNNIDTLSELGSGKFTFAVVGSADALDGIFSGVPVSIISAYMRKTPIALATKPDIYFPEDLKDKKIMAVEADLKNAMFFNMWKEANIDVNDLNIVDRNFSIDEFISGEVDAIEIYTTDEVYELASKNVYFNIIDNSNFGTDFYDTMLITLDSFAKSNPNFISKFKEATNKGWLYALDNKEEMLDLITAKYNTQNKSREALSFEASRLNSIIESKNSEIGEVSSLKLDEIAQIYYEMGVVSEVPNMEKYIFSYKDTKKINLSNEEKIFLKNEKTLKVCVNPNWHASNVDINDKDHEHQGLAESMVQKISSILNMPLEYVETKSWTESLEFAKAGKCDIFPIISKTKDRESWLNFTKTYFSQPLVVATNNEHIYVEDFSQLKNAKMALVKDYAYIEEIKELYPNLEIVKVNSPLEGLLKAKRGEVFGYIDVPSSIAFLIKNEGLSNIKLVGKLKDVSLKLTIGTPKNKPLLNSIMTKAIDVISPSFIKRILNDFYTIKYEKGIDYKLVKQISFASLLVFVLMFYWARKVKRANSMLKQVQADLEVKNKQLKKVSITDNLTGLYNRHKLDDVLYSEVDRFNRYEREFGVILLDIDYFKKVNDTYGHQLGDYVLVEVANLLKESTRVSDVVGRWGGEEFIIVCVETNCEGLNIIAEKCRAAIENYKFDKVGKVTASFGLAAYSKNIDLDELISHADHCLYKAKENGRNQVSSNCTLL